VAGRATAQQSLRTFFTYSFKCSVFRGFAFITNQLTIFDQSVGGKGLFLTALCFAMLSNIWGCTNQPQNKALDQSYYPGPPVFDI
jgi:hypothetical protein